jgi:hypothetical protein
MRLLNCVLGLVVFVLVALVFQLWHSKRADDSFLVFNKEGDFQLTGDVGISLKRVDDELMELTVYHIDPNSSISSRFSAAPDSGWCVIGAKDLPDIIVYDGMGIELWKVDGPVVGRMNVEPQADGMDGD